MNVRYSPSRISVGLAVAIVLATSWVAQPPWACAAIVDAHLSDVHEEAHPPLEAMGPIKDAFCSVLPERLRKICV